ncbi:hypothetical protein AVEN_130527-1 [Araneus ventricosus]|uniref:Uncharacterized protein n=1 Tax=Araneus ventricosus TaxID=182803 RepID=A0A4Y2EI41_ARAVE|nr:hypothetical protein AVEN_130527-1 [Araneus ventricosus]
MGKNDQEEHKTSNTPFSLSMRKRTARLNYHRFLRHSIALRDAIQRIYASDEKANDKKSLKMGKVELNRYRANSSELIIAPAVSHTLKTISILPRLYEASQKFLNFMRSATVNLFEEKWASRTGRTAHSSRRARCRRSRKNELGEESCFGW